MTKIGRTLSYINTSERKKASLEASTEKIKSSKSVFFNGGGGGEYLLKSVWNKAFEFRKDLNGNEYLFGKLPLVLQYGLTMYADNGTLDLPSIYDGLPIDNSTLVWGDGVLKVNPNIELGGGLDESELAVYLTNNNYAKKSDITSALSGYATTSSLNAVSTKLNDFLEGSDTDTVINKWKELETFLSGLTESDNLATILTGKADKSYVDTNFVTIAGTEDVTGLHNFVNGLKIGGMPITKMQDDVIYIDANLVVRGGVTMYSDDSAFTPSTIMDGVVVDGTSIRKNPTTGALEVIGGSGSTTKYPLSWSGFNQGSYDGSVAQSFYIPTKLSEFVNDKSFATTSDLSGYLPLSGGTLSGNLFIGNLDTTVSRSIVFQRSGLHMSINTNDYRLSLLYQSTENIVTKLVIGNNFLYYYYNSTPYTIWHAGNFTPSNYLLASTYTASDILTKLKTVDGSGSGLDADLLDGKHYSDIINGNVASATKLQTARTIWGQSFDGTNDVSGDMTVNLGWDLLGKWSDGSGGILGFSSNGYIQLGYGVATRGYATYINGNDIIFRYGTSHTEGMRLTPTGNVLIGTTTDSGYKLDVKGTIHTNSSLHVDSYCNFKGYLFLNSLAQGVALTGRGVFWHNIENSITRDLVKYSSDGSVNIVNKLKVSNIPIYKSQDDVLYIDGNLVVRGGVTMYAENEVDIPSIIDSLPIANANTQDKASKGIASFDSAYFKVTDGWVTLTSAPSSISTIGSLQDVSTSVSGTTNSDVVLFKSANSNTWTTKPLSEIGGGGGSVSGDYLPLSGGTINGSGSYSAIPLVIKNNNKQFSGLSIYAYTTERVHLGYWSSLGGVRFENVACGAGLSILDDKTLSYYKINSDGTIVKDAILHSGNYSSYALPLSGGTITGDLAIGGNVGIGTTSPSRALHIVGSMVTENGSIETFQSVSQGGKSSFIKINTYYTPLGEEWASFIVSDYYGANWCTTGGFTHGMYFKSGRYQFDNFIFLDSQGNPVARLSSSNTGMGHHFMGNALFTGGITMYSDIRKKTKLQDVELSLSQIANAPLIEHYYNSDQNKTTHVGSIAQYWAELNDWFCKLDNEGYYTMEIQNCALASAISIARHLEKYESKTDEKIRMLKKRISQLEDELELLKKGV